MDRQTFELTHRVASERDQARERLREVEQKRDYLAGRLATANQDAELTRVANERLARQLDDRERVIKSLRAGVEHAENAAAAQVSRAEQAEDERDQLQRRVDALTAAKLDLEQRVNEVLEANAEASRRAADTEHWRQEAQRAEQRQRSADAALAAAHGANEAQAVMVQQLKAVLVQAHDRLGDAIEHRIPADIAITTAREVLRPLVPHPANGETIPLPPRPVATVPTAGRT